MNVQGSASSDASNIQLANQTQLPEDALLTFSVRSKWPATFSRDQTVDVATTDESSSVSLTFNNGGLMLENPSVAVATLNPAKAFGGSAFGPLQFRINSKGVTGDWQQLASLVRLPTLKELMARIGHSSTRAAMIYSTRAEIAMTLSRRPWMR